MTTAVGAGAAAEHAQRLVAEVRDDPIRRMSLASDAYTFHPGNQRYRPYGQAVVAFMHWQHARGTLNPPTADAPGSRWWRAVNEDLLRDTWEAKLLAQDGTEQPSKPTVQRWVSFFRTPSAHAWYLAHNASIVASYLSHCELATYETPAERFFMNVTLVRVLYAHALVCDGSLALGRLSFLSGLVGHPRTRMPAVFLAMKGVLPVRYPIVEVAVEELIERENPLGRALDYGVIGARIDALYSFSARVLDEPRLRGLIQQGAPIYAWPFDERHVWHKPPGQPMKSVINVLTGPRGADAWSVEARKGPKRGHEARVGRTAASIATPKHGPPSVTPPRSPRLVAHDAAEPFSGTAIASAADAPGAGKAAISSPAGYPPGVGRSVASPTSADRRARAAEMSCPAGYLNVRNVNNVNTPGGRSNACTVRRSTVAGGPRRPRRSISHHTDDPADDHSAPPLRPYRGCQAGRRSDTQLGHCRRVADAAAERWRKHP